ncbi:MAG: hypothetical protein ACXABY_01495 [Candidatus Thorarchaeota archaeon]
MAEYYQPAERAEEVGRRLNESDAFAKWVVQQRNKAGSGAHDWFTVLESTYINLMKEKDNDEALIGLCNKGDHLLAEWVGQKEDFESLASQCVEGWLEFVGFCAISRGEAARGGIRLSVVKKEE